MTRRAVVADDLFEHRIPVDVQISRDGALVVWTERRADRATGKVVSALWAARRGDDAHPLTSGRRDRAPRISPDGKTIAFLRAAPPPAKDDVTWLCTMPVDGGEARTVIELRGDIAAPAWSPDSRQIALSYRAADVLPEGDDAPLSIRVDRLPYKADGGGYLPRDRFRIYVIDPWADAPALLPLTTAGDWDDREPAWSPDGRQLAFVSNRRQDRGIDLDNTDLYRVDLATGREHACTRERGMRMAPVWSPDGSWIAVVSCPAPRGHALFQRNVSLHRADPGGERPEQCLLPDLDRCAMNLTIDDVWGLENWSPAPQFRSDGRAVIVSMSERGTTSLIEIGLRGDGQPTGDVRRLVNDRVVLYSALARDTGELAIITTSPTEPGWIDVVAPDRSRRSVARPFADYLAQVEVREPIELVVPSPGGVEVQAWLLLPPGDGPFPLLLSIHGGPIVQFGRAFLHEQQLLCAAGYAVLFANPRGSQGYGEAFASAIYRNWCDPAMEDLLAVLDHAIAHHPIDPDRLGVLGGSYGGFMTSMLVAHTRRFRAACTERCVSSMDAMMWGDLGIVLADELGALPWDDPELYARLSPLTFAAQIETPLLILHGLADHRTPPDQGERLFVTLRRMGKPVEMVLFPGGTHDLSRAGPPRQRVERLGVLLDWFARKL